MTKVLDYPPFLFQGRMAQPGPAIADGRRADGSCDGGDPRMAGWSKRPVHFPDVGESPAMLRLRRDFALCRRYAEYLVSLSEGRARRNLSLEIILVGQDIFGRLDELDGVTSAVVTRLLVALEPVLDQAIANPGEAQQAVLASRWLVLGLFDGFAVLGPAFLPGAVGSDGEALCTSDGIRADQVHRRLLAQFLQHLAGLRDAFAAAAQIPLPSCRPGACWPRMQDTQPDVASLHDHLAEGLRILADRLGHATERQEIALLTAARARIARLLSSAATDGGHAALASVGGATEVFRQILNAAAKNPRGGLCSFLGQCEHYLDRLDTLRLERRDAGADEAREFAGHPIRHGVVPDGRASRS